MKTVVKILLISTTVVLGGLLGAWAAPSDMVHDASSVVSIFLIIGGAVGGLFVGGLAILLCD